MELGTFYTEVHDDRISEILSHITGDEIRSLHQVCQRYGEDEEDVRYYNVYRAETASGSKILKMTDEREAFQYERYLAGMGFAVPIYYGKWVEQEHVWILLENVSGDDLRDMTDKLALSADGRFEGFWRDHAIFPGSRTIYRPRHRN